jgi:recombination protein RecA
MTKEEKLTLLDKESEKINTDFGSGTIMSLSEKPHTKDDIISTGSLELDIALGVGGLPKGRIVEIYGGESSGKTTIATHVVAESQKQGGVCVYIDAEHAFDRDYAANIGVNVDELRISQADFGEQSLSVAEHVIDTGAVDVVVIDSVAALVPQGEYEGEMGESKMGLQARLMSQALRKLAGKVSKNNVLLIFINQIREKIGVMFGNPETTSGGNALKFYASVRLRVSREIPKGATEPTGNKVTVKVVKNKVAPPFRKAEFDIIFGQGIDRAGEVIDKAVELDIIKKSGSWFVLPDGTKQQGRDKLRELLVDNEEYYKQIEKQVLDGIE